MHNKHGRRRKPGLPSTWLLGRFISPAVARRLAPVMLAFLLS